MIRSVKQMNAVDWSKSTNSNENAGFGALQTDAGCLPLAAMCVKAQATGLLAEIVVRQEFYNPTDDSLEATYIFPLPPRAAVTQLKMHVAGKTIESQLKERSEARQAYREAVRRGNQAALLEEDRSDVFTLQVGNLPTHERIEVELRLSVLLDASAGTAELRFPLVVAPRYVSGLPLRLPPVGQGVAEDTVNVPDASRITPPVLLPGFPNPVRLSLAVELTKGTLPPGVDAASQMSCSLENTVIQDHETLRIEVSPRESVNRDFVLRFPVASEHVSTALRTSSVGPDRPDVFSLTLMPPKLSPTELPIARDIVFLLDHSGSMHGWKIVAARRALGRMIDTLHDHDHFGVIAFNHETNSLPGECSLLKASNANRWRALQWISQVSSSGGTELRRALEDALQQLSSDTQSRREKIVVIVTDGQIAGEDEVLRLLGTSSFAKELRAFTIGIDQAVNEGFLRRVADHFQGQCHLVESEQRLDESLESIKQSLDLPMLTQVQLEPINCDWELSRTIPSRLPDLYPGRSVLIFGRCHKSRDEFGFRVHGLDRSGKAWASEAIGQPTSLGKLLPQWGRAMIRELEDRGAAHGGDDGLRKEIVDVSLESGVISRFTAFVAIDPSRIVNPEGQNTEVTQPVEFPAGWEVPAYSSLSSVTGPPILAACSMSQTADYSLRSPRRLKLGFPKWHRVVEQQKPWQKVLLDAVDLEAQDVRVRPISGQHQVVYVTKSKRVTRKALSDSDRRELLEWALSFCGISDYGVLTTERSVRTTQDVGRFRIEFNLKVYPPASRQVLRLTIIDINQSQKLPNS
ncbi:MAG: VWA domain-containing protein [Planctomycetales bacterium]|nr:VWA domain-containing protein [Planctomycetales bacterium]